MGSWMTQNNKFGIWRKKSYYPPFTPHCVIFGATLEGDFRRVTLIWPNLKKYEEKNGVTWTLTWKKFLSFWAFKLSAQILLRKEVYRVHQMLPYLHQKSSQGGKRHLTHFTSTSYSVHTFRSTFSTQQTYRDWCDPGLRRGLKSKHFLSKLTN